MLKDVDANLPAYMYLLTCSLNGLVQPGMAPSTCQIDRDAYTLCLLEDTDANDRHVLKAGLKASWSHDSEVRSATVHVLPMRAVSMRAVSMRVFSMKALSMRLKKS